MSETIEHRPNCVRMLIDGPAHCSCDYVERWHSREVETLQAALTKLKSERDTLMEVVRPFADAALFLNGIAAKAPLMLPSYVDVEDHEVDVTVGDLRKARDVRNAIDADTGGK